MIVHNNLGRINYLDSSRGIAALIVLFAHFQLTFLPVLTGSWVYQSPLKLLVDGEAAVLYFFILSGYVLTFSVLKVRQLDLSTYIKFLISRIFRIYPAFLVSLILYFLIIRSFPAHPDNWLGRYWQSSPDLSSLIKQALLVLRYPNEPELRLLPHDWTLSIEVAVSLLLPVLVFASLKSAELVLLFTYCSVKFLGLEPFAFDFSLGIYLALKRNRLVRSPIHKPVIYVLLVIGLTIVCSDYFFPMEMKSMDKLLIHHKSYGLAVLLFIILISERVQKILSFPFLVQIGKVSYSLYLLHLAFLYCLVAFAGELNSAVLFTLFLLISLFASLVSYKYIERPCISIGRKVAERFIPPSIGK